MKTLDMEYHPVNRAVSLEVFEQAVLALVDPTILNLMYRAEWYEVSGTPAIFVKSKALRVDGAAHNRSPRKVAYKVERLIAKYLIQEGQRADPTHTPAPAPRYGFVTAQGIFDAVLIVAVCMAIVQQ